MKVLKHKFFFILNKIFLKVFHSSYRQFEYTLYVLLSFLLFKEITDRELHVEVWWEDFRVVTLFWNFRFVLKFSKFLKVLKFIGHRLKFDPMFEFVLGFEVLLMKNWMFLVYFTLK